MQQKSYRDRYLKKHIYTLSKCKQFPDDVSFLCRKCKEFVCQTHDVRCIQGSHHVIINNDVRNTKVLVSNVQSVDNFRKVVYSSTFIYPVKWEGVIWCLKMKAENSLIN